MKDKWVKRWKVEGSNGNVYTVAVDRNGAWGCSCPAWKFRRQICKHIRYVQTDNPEPSLEVQKIC